MRRFELHRDEDETGVSGTGIVAEGVIFSDGSSSMKWIVGDYRSLVSFPPPNAAEAIDAIHGHNGKTRIVWKDGE